jgi:hypothetical protein
MSEPLKILFKYPSRGRPERFFKSLDSIVDNISDVDYYHVACTLDEDDATMNNSEVIERINSYKTTSIQWGKSISKIDAINRSMPDYPFDILICMSDDMVFNIFGFDTMIRVDMATHFPALDGLIHYPDQDAKEFLATMYIAGKRFYERFGYIYHPSYKSLWCDNEIMLVAQMLKKYKYMGYQINLHLNPAYESNRMERDEMFNRQQGDWPHDESNFNTRKARNFDLEL